MSAINLIDNERNMHMLPAPPQPAPQTGGGGYTPPPVPMGGAQTGAAGAGCCPGGGLHLSTLAGIPSSGLGLEQLVTTSVPGMPSFLGDDMLYKLSRGLPLSRPIPPDCRPPCPCIGPSGCYGSYPGGHRLITNGGFGGGGCGNCGGGFGSYGCGGCGGCGMGCMGPGQAKPKSTTVDSPNGGMHLHYHPNPTCMDWVAPILGAGISALKGGLGGK